MKGLTPREEHTLECPDPVFGTHPRTEDIASPDQVDVLNELVERGLLTYREDDGRCECGCVHAGYFITDLGRTSLMAQKAVTRLEGVRC